MVGFPLKRSSWYGTNEVFKENDPKKKKKSTTDGEEIDETMRLGTRTDYSNRDVLDTLIQTDLDKLNAVNEVDIHLVEAPIKKGASRWNLFLGRVGSNGENGAELDSHSDKDDRNSVSEQQSVQSTIEDTNTSTMVRTMSLGPSVTPFKIRDNINHLLGIRQSEDKELQLSEDILSQVSKIYDSLGRSSLSDLQVDHAENIFSGVPCTRFALLNHSQNLAYLYQLNSIKKNLNGYLLYFKWCVWLIKVSNGDKRSEIDRIIENNQDLRVFINQIKKIISKTYYKIHIFKFGITPSRKARDQIGSETLEFRVPFELQEDLLKQLVSIILRDEIYRPESIQCK